ncbi:NAD(P)/FAD-dependent oxidoreductase [Arthrobacter sp. MDT3-44]
MPVITQPAQDRYDVVVVGGGAAGLSAAVTLGRALRSVLVLDSGRPRNAAASGVHGFLSREGMSPRGLLEIGRAEAEGYGATVVAAEVTSVQRDAEGFIAGTADGRRFSGRRLLVTTGLTDGLPDIPGLRTQWGRGVIHCPYCHGYEVRGRSIGILGTGPLSVHQALLFRQWSDDITLFLNDTVTPTDDEWGRLAARSVRVVDGPVASIDEEDHVLTGVTVQGARRFPLHAVAVGTRMESNSGLLEALGLRPEDHPSGMGSFVAPGQRGMTSVRGVYVAGNVSNLAAQVVVAAAEGTMAGAAINADLVEEETAWAVEGYSGPFSASSEAGVSVRVLGTRRHGLDDGAGTGAAASTGAPLQAAAGITGAGTEEGMRRAG